MCIIRENTIFSPLSANYGGGRHQNVYQDDLICAQNVDDRSKSGVKRCRLPRLYYLCTPLSYFLLRFFDKIPTKNPILKALILSFVAMVIIEVLSTLVNPYNASVTLLIDTGMNVPRFLALGIVVGHLYDKLNGGA